MPVVENEQTVKGKSLFLEYDGGDGNSLILLSKLYKVDFHYLKTHNKYTSCRENPNNCIFCQHGYEPGTEYNYYVDLNGQRGVMNIKGSVFFAIQKIAKAQKKDPRQISWTVIKTGEGKSTKYTVSKDDNLASEDYERIQSELAENTQKLTGYMLKQEEIHEQNYLEYSKGIQKQNKSAEEPEDEYIPSESKDPEQDVQPDDVPF